MRVFTQVQRPQIHVATMQTLQHRTIFVKKVSVTMILILENNENKTTCIECLTASGSEKEKVVGQFLDSVIRR